MAKILVTGAFGQIGSELVPALQKKYGVANIIAVGHTNVPKDFSGKLEIFDPREKERLASVVRTHSIDTIYHLVSLLSAKGEIDPNLTWDINMNGLLNVLNIAKEHNLKVFWPSSIAAFGPTTPNQQTPQKTVMEPTTMYGVTKVSGELLCQYFFTKYGVDVRSLRYPGIISWKAEPGGGTTDYAVAIFYEGLRNGKYTFFVQPDTILPMMYMDDAVRATLMLMEADPQQITIRTSYNLAAISFRADELAQAVSKYLPVNVDYQPDHRQKIADSWPKTIDDTEARRDWGWQHNFDLDGLTKEMVTQLKTKLGM